MIRKILLAAAVLLLPILFLNAAQAQTRLLRYPSYSHGKVTFSYLGDIWVANEDGSGVQRITDNRAREINPRFSPDGKWIAFSSNREGNYDVYVVSAQGGKPKQLTFHSADDTVVGWTPDGKKIIFTSSRGVGVFPGVLTLFEISAEGGMEQAISTDWGSWASYSADGTKLAFSRHPGVWSRQHYRGSYAVDLWLMDVAAKKFTKLSDDDYKGNYLWPMYAPNGEIYFVADRLPNEKGLQFGGPAAMKSVNNIWKMSDKGGAPVQVTHHTSGNLYFPSMSADGKTIVYEEDFGLWKLDVASGKSAEIKIDIKSDTKENDSELRTITNEAQGFSLSPSARRAAIVTHGEIFTVATDRGEIQRVTETAWREGNPQWSPDGKWIAFVSDRTGREEIWIADELGNNSKKISDADCDKSSLLWAPDSKSMLWTGSDHSLRRVDVESGKTDVLASSDTGPIGTPQFSPDGKWVSYSKQDALLRSHIYVKPLDGSAEHMIGSEEFLVANGAKWTPDGKNRLPTCAPRAGIDDCVRLRFHAARTRPSAPPTKAMATFSTTSWRMMRRRPAPSAVRTAISFCRLMIRASCRLATLAAASSSTKAAVAIRMITKRSVTLLVNSRMGTMTPVRPSFVSGCSRARRFESVAISARAWANGTSGFRRPRTARECVARSFFSAGVRASGAQISVPRGKSKFAGITPAIV